MSVSLGQSVTYVSSTGLQKAAIVIGTPESVEPGHSIPVPESGQVHLLVFSFRGVSPRLSVPSKALAETIEDFTVDGNLVGYFQPA